MLWRLVRHTEESMVDYGILLPLRGPVAMSRFVTIAGQVKLEFYSQRSSQEPVSAILEIQQDRCGGQI